MKKILIVLLASIVLSGCQSTAPLNTYYGEGLDLEANKPAISGIIKSSIKDPDSLKNISLLSVNCYLTSLWAESFIVGSESKCIFSTYNATNSYGGYVRGEMWFYVDKDSNMIREAYRYKKSSLFVNYNNEKTNLVIVK